MHKFRKAVAVPLQWLPGSSAHFASVFFSWTKHDLSQPIQRARCGIFMSVLKARAVSFSTFDILIYLIFQSCTACDKDSTDGLKDSSLFPLGLVEKSDKLFPSLRHASGD